MQYLIVKYRKSYHLIDTLAEEFYPDSYGNRIYFEYHGNKLYSIESITKNIRAKVYRGKIVEASDNIESIAKKYCEFLGKGNKKHASC